MSNLFCIKMFFGGTQFCAPTPPHPSLALSLSLSSFQLLKNSILHNTTKWAITVNELDRAGILLADNIIGALWNKTLG